LVTVAGLMSTDTSGTDAGRMFPVAMECSIVATMIAKPTSASSARMARWPSMTSVWTSGSGPSSRTEPTRTNGLPASTMACMTPPVSTPFSTAAAMEPAARMVLIARMWCSCPCGTPEPLDRSTPSEVPNSEDSMSWVARALPAKSTST
jgi:hypothetical protein